MSAHHDARRDRLTAEVGGAILLLGNGVRDRNLPGYGVRFRQDSTFLYYTGCTIPGAAVLLHDGCFTLYLQAAADDDVLWHGPGASPAEIGARLGATKVLCSRELPASIRTLQDRQVEVHTVAVADAARNAAASGWLGTVLVFGSHNGSEALIDAIIRHRRAKSALEIEEMRRAAAASCDAHRAIVACTREGIAEADLAALFTGVLGAHGCVPGYDTILSQDGDILHNHAHTNTLTAGRMVLCDGGGEVATGYGVDITRTWPVSGTFTARQAAAYDAVLRAQLASIELCRPGVRYRAVHDAACMVLAEFLVDEGLLRGSAEDVVATGAHALFFPHGVGHHLGLDVHDMENFGDRPSYPTGSGRPQGFGTRYLRLDLPLEEDWVVTVEPGFYVVDAILDDAALTVPHRDMMAHDRIAKWRGFGGIRIEDDVHVTSCGPSVLTSETPKTPAEIQALVGSRPPPRAFLTGF
ncbi:MAG: Xaa-Pro aminopeptidase [Myxococcota bacterium]|jgi:Xaa-Pro aminopeptidase